MYFVLSLPINMLQCLNVLCQTIPLSSCVGAVLNSNQAVSEDCGEV